jgi:hypothetical protein
MKVRFCCLSQGSRNDVSAALSAPFFTFSFSSSCLFVCVCTLFHLLEGRIDPLELTGLSWIVFREVPSVNTWNSNVAVDISFLFAQWK